MSLPPSLGFSVDLLNAPDIFENFRHSKRPYKKFEYKRLNPTMEVVPDFPWY